MDPNVQKSTSASDARKQSAPRPPRFDTMNAVENLKEAEFREQQAMAIIETTRNAKGEFVALYVRGNSLQEEFEGCRQDLRNFGDEMRKGFARLNLLLLVLGVVLAVGGSLAIIQVTGG